MRQPPRHLMIVHGHWPDPRVEREARALIADGFDVDVLCLRGEGDPPESPTAGLRVERLPIRRVKGASARRQIFEYLAFLAAATVRATALHARRRYRTAQVHNPPDFLVFATLLLKLTGTRVILDLHDLMPEFFASRFGRRFDSRLVRLILRQERLATWFADRVITVTDLWRKTLVDRGVPRAKVSVLMNLPDPAVFGRPVDGAARTDERFVLIYHGTLTRRYGVDVALRALAVARRSVPLAMIVHGRGEQRESLLRLRDELGLGDAVVFTEGRLPSEELPALIRRADAGVVPYRRDVFTDGILPTKLMEYVALGVPAIATRTPAVEAYFDETMVRFVPSEDVDALAAAIVVLAREPDLRSRLAQAAARFAMDHDWPTESGRYVSLVRDLAERR